MLLGGSGRLCIGGARGPDVGPAGATEVNSGSVGCLVVSGLAILILSKDGFKSFIMASRPLVSDGFLLGWVLDTDLDRCENSEAGGGLERELLVCATEPIEPRDEVELTGV